jgi:hypothetical protein
MPSYPDRAQEAAIVALREAGFVPDGQALGRLRFTKPGTKRKVTIGMYKTCFYDAPAPFETRTVAVVPTSNLERIRLVAQS